MSLFNNAIIGASSQGGYQISRSVRTRSSASAYFNRTLTTPTNNLKWTWSGWLKRGTLSVANVPFGAGDGSSNNFGSLQFTTSDTLQFAQINAGSYNVQMITSAVFRDPAAWYHIQVVYDSANATSTDRVQIYVNGVRQSVTYSTGPFAQNTASKINSAIAHYISKLDYTTVYFDGYQTEVNFIDGQALTPSSFGETDVITGVWKPKKYAGTYGTNGFYLNFSDNSNNTAATIGKDNSGNGNNWTPNNISVTAGATYDSMLDVPTMWADGGNGRGNYCVMNPLDSSSASNAVSGGNLNVTITSNASVRGSFYVSTGKWYYEVTVNTLQNLYLGLASNAGRPTSYTQTSAFGVNNAGDIYQDNVEQTQDSIALAAGSIYGIAFDADAKRFWISKNGQWYSCDRTPDITISVSDVEAGTYGYNFSSLTGDSFAPHFGNSTTAGAAVSANFGQRPFAYTPPSGFVAMNTQNLPDATIKKGNAYFDAKLWTGNGTSQTITGLSFQPDFAWIKARSTTYQHSVYDSVRTTSAGRLATDQTLAETSNGANDPSFTSDGITVRAVLNDNGSGQTFVGWMWDAGTTTVTNTSGSISAQVRANPTAGFSVVTYTGTGANATVGHGLGVAPSMIITKSRTSTIQNWYVYHTSIGATKGIYLNTTDATTTSANFWNNTAPTSSVFSVGIGVSATTYVAYCFAPVAGYSAFGSYTGNGSANGPFVFLGFRPRFLLVKSSSNIERWLIWDTSRDTYNQVGLDLVPSSSATEGGATPALDILSNGFKLRSVSSSAYNASGFTYIYAAFAENPFKHSLAR
jgi:hypothetical protein